MIIHGNTFISFYVVENIKISSVLRIQWNEFNVFQINVENEI